MDILQWFAGGSHPYMTLYHCMAHDTPWVILTVSLDLTIAAGYLLIARHWRENERLLPASPAKTALGRMKAIFLLCGLCGYVFIPIKMVWPAWRLYDLALIALAGATWRYAWGARDLRVVYSQLQRADRLERDLAATRDASRRKGDVFNAIGHDLRTPLNRITLQADLLELIHDDGHAPTAEERQARDEALGGIRSAAREAAGLLDRLLEFGRAGTLVAQPAPIDLATALGRAIDRVRPVAGPKGLALAATCPPGLVVRTDPTALDQILANLLDNAVTYTDRGRVTVVAAREGPEIGIAVVDTGPGIAGEHLGRLFDEFYQVHNPERDRLRGYGLGLAIARRLAEGLGGRIDVDSRPGEGSRFRLHLPDGQRAGRGSGTRPNPQGERAVVAAPNPDR